MLLAIDIGNTNIVMGVFSEETLVNDWRIVTAPSKTEDEYGIIVYNLYRSANLDLKQTDGIIISSVVPPIMNTMERLCARYFHINPLIVGPGLKTGMPIRYDNPHEVGADRIVNAVAAYDAFKSSLIVVDFGTATTFDCVSPQGEYMGGAIAPGIGISSEALFKAASKLPRIELVKPESIIGKNTVTSLQAGIVYGYIAMVDGIVEKIKKQVKTNPKVVATGGLATFIAAESKCIDEVDPMLTLKGLRIIYEKNVKYRV
ncbi:MAG TPA: type III pantothenate kinase [Thermodesulfobacteriota bacterium]|nr:type III pantothenate kinase [Deltaproteobacteria bacterium]HNR12496.1 type III pantothenate kinase [Thermodesulfobacteriota bacterium]HNU70490.1 type III pantothenate kinase [Thermodesulfobacteriota bacterium]HOC38586.1 type III pantothenate kinase [Thermodesulfobacteriota bacterium]HQO76965.1 type III pantothenate kinase [Thermodesulfobacteriota bacterium]